MSQTNFKPGFQTKILFMAIVMGFYFVSDSFGRDGVKLYSIGNNSAWSLPTTWSLSENGTVAGIFPQNNDTVVINNTIIQNIDFSFSGVGMLVISNTGLLRGDNQSLNFNGNSKLKCNGELKINNLNFSDNSSFIVESEGEILVKNSFITNSSSDQIISGKLSVTGFLSALELASIKGNGVVVSAHYDGSGSVFGISNTSLIPDGSLITEYNWTGNLDKNWNEPMNWAGNVVPDKNTNVAIVSSLNDPEITGTIMTNNFYVNSGSAVTVYPNAVAEINGNLSVIGVGKFLLKNTISEKSSLVLNGDATGKIQSEYQVIKEQENLISSPVEMAMSETFKNMYLRTYDESSSQWGIYITPTNDPLQVMQGYELFSLSSDTRIFEGTPIHDQKTFAISNSGDGLNLTGNPFTSFIDWENNSSDAWQRNSIASAIYYPDPSGSGNFSVYLPGGDDAVSLNNGSRYIAPMQGFFVKAGKEGSLTVNESSRVSAMSKSKITVKNNSLKFKLNDSDGSKDEVILRVMDNASFGFDDQLDAVKIPGNNGAPSLALQSDDYIVKYAINTIPTINSSTSIPLNIVCSKAGQYSISALGATDFEYRYPVILEDKELSTFVDLRVDSVYSFYQTPDMSSNRFEIHFMTPNAISEQVVDPSQVTVTPGQVVLSGNDNDVYTANLYSIDGKLLSMAKGTLSGGISLTTDNKAAGICILTLSNGKQNITKKIFTK